MKTKYIAVARRFIKAYISGAATVLSLVTISNVHTWTELTTSLQAILLASVVGGLNGVFLATEKYLRWKD